MAIHSILRMTLLTLLPISLCGAAFGAEGPMTPSKSVDYKRADTNFYAKGDVLKSDPTAIILPPTAFAQNGDTYTFTPKKKAPKTLYVEATSDWIEPITPPDMPASLNIAPDAMQIREPQGDVQVALPNAPTTFSPVTDGMTLPNGAVIKTGTNATAAILFGGVDSARLMPDSEAAVQQTVTATSRSAEVDLTAGGVFSKVGTQVGVTSDFQVHTPFGHAIAQAGDFAAVTLSGRTDVWVSQGTVELLQPDGKKFGVVAADGFGPLKLIRFPAIASAAQSQQADAESLTAVLNFIPVADQKLAALHAKEAKGTALSANEQAYVQRIKQVPALIKLALVEPPPAPPPPAPTATITPAQLSIAPPRPAPPEPSTGGTYYGATTIVKPPAPPQPVTVIVHANGTIRFRNITMGLEEFQAAIKALVAAHPDQAVIIKASPKVDYAKFTAIVDACKNAPAREVDVAPPAPQPPAAPSNPAPGANPYVAIVPGQTPAPPKPLTVLIHEDGSIGFQGKRGTLADFKAELAALVQATPDREVVIKASSRAVAYDDVKAVLGACAEAHVTHVGFAMPAPAAPLPVTAETPPTPATNAAPVAPAMPVTAETPPARPAPKTPPKPPQTFDEVRKQGIVPSMLGLDAKGQIDLDGIPFDEDGLKTRLTTIAQTDPDRPLVLVKQAGVTRAQWHHVVDIVHSAKLRVWVFSEAEFKKRYVPPPPPNAGMAIPTPRPAAAEGGGTAQPSPEAPLSASPAPESAPPNATASPAEGEAVPVEIELTPDGQISFLGEVVSESDLKSRLDGVAQNNSREPVLIVKDEKVTHDEWQKIVDLCHAAKLKVRLKTVKSSDSGALKPRAQNAAVASAPPPAAPDVISSTGEKIVPVEIDLATEGRISLEGASVNVDELEARLARVAKADPQQPVLIVRKSDVTDDSVEALVTLCQSVDPHFQVSVKTEPAFLPPAPPETSPAENLPAPSVHMHPSMDALDGSTSAAAPTP